METSRNTADVSISTGGSGSRASPHQPGPPSLEATGHSHSFHSWPETASFFSFIILTAYFCSPFITDPGFHLGCVWVMSSLDDISNIFANSSHFL